MSMKPITDRDAANTRAILESIADARADGEYARAEMMVHQVAALPPESLHIIIEVAAALAVTVRDELRTPHAPQAGGEGDGDQ